MEMGSFSICLLPLFPSCKPNKPVTFEGLRLEVQWEHSHSWSWREELNLQPDLPPLNQVRSGVRISG